MAKIERHVYAPLPETHLPGKACGDSNKEITRHKTSIYSLGALQNCEGGISNHKQETPYYTILVTRLTDKNVMGGRKGYSPNDFLYV